MPEKRPRFLTVFIIIAIAFLLFGIGFNIIPKLIAGYKMGGVDVGSYVSEIGADATVDELYEKIITDLSNGDLNVDVGLASEKTIYSAVHRVYDKADFFWLDNNYQISNLASFSKIIFHKIYDDVDVRKAKIDSVADEILKDMPRGDDFDKVLYIYDSLMNLLEYVDDESAEVHNIYGAFVNKKCVCEGYAKAFSYLLDKAGIENYLYSGEADNDDSMENHLWNGVMMDGELYYFDITWDDSEEFGKRYDYFGLTSAEIQKNHFFDDDHPVVKSEATKDNYYVHNGLVIDSYSDEAFADIVSKQGDIVCVKCSSVVPYEDLLMVINSPMKLSNVLSMAGADKIEKTGYSYISNEKLRTVTLYLK